jgi:hypothetical protein
LAQHADLQRRCLQVISNSRAVPEIDKHMPTLTEFGSFLSVDRVKRVERYLALAKPARGL